MMAIPDISVVMGVHNNVGTLPAALASIQSQEDVALEFIVIDDGSTDGSAAILDEAAEKDPRLRVVHKKNEGLTRALIDGCALATAPWIARQDADDVSLPGRLKMQLARAQQADAPVLVGCGSRTLAPAGEVLAEYHPPTETARVARHVLEEGQAISPHGSILFRREAYEKVGGYRLAFFYAQDIDLTTRLAEIGPVGAVPDVLYEYRLSPTAITGRQGRHQLAFYHLIRRGYELRHQGLSDNDLLAQAERLRQKCLRQKKQKGPSAEFYYYLGARLAGRRPDRAAAYFRQAWALRPWSPKMFFRWRQVVWASRSGGAR